MDLPPSGWYPDPYGAPDLLRWWDGATWTQHTHPGVGGADGGTSSGGGALAGGATGGGWASRDRVIGEWAGTDWPTGAQLADTKPPKGPRTEPQPALPNAYQRAVAATAVQPATVAPTTVQPTTVQPIPGQPSNGWGTQVLFDAWPGPGGPGAANRYGYQQAQQRRRLWLIGGLAAGTAVSIAIIVVVATSLGSKPGPSTADQAAPSTPAAKPTPSALATTAGPTPSASVSTTPPASVLSDGQSGLSYEQLAAPWTPVCPSNLTGAFGWTAGESAAAGQINGGQTTWYGEACSGPLPAQYNYSGVQDLENTATNVAQTLENAYYNALNHTTSPMASEPVTVSGHAGWEIEYQVTYTNAAAQGATWTTENGAVVVADTGAGNSAVVFFASVPDTLGVSNVSSLVSSLQLTVVPSADGSPTATATAPATAPGPPTPGPPTPPAPGRPTPTGANP
jgi:hypothetical protein